MGIFLDILGKLLVAFVFTGIWYIASMFITYIICQISKKDFHEYFKDDSVMFWTNFILISICCILFYNGEIF